MHHGTLMFRSDLSVVSDVLNVSSDKFQSKAAKSVRSRVTNIAPFLKTDLSLKEFQDLVIKYIMKTDRPVPYTFSEEELAEIYKIKVERYDTHAWNYGYSPAYAVVKKRYFDQCGMLEIHMNCENGSIRDLKFYGDFFGKKDPALLAEALIGLPLERNALTDVFRSCKVSDFFHGIEQEVFLSYLLESE